MKKTSNQIRKKLPKQILRKCLSDTKILANAQCYTGTVRISFLAASVLNYKKRHNCKITSCIYADIVLNYLSGKKEYTEMWLSGFGKPKGIRPQGACIFE